MLAIIDHIDLPGVQKQTVYRLISLPFLTAKLQLATY